MELVVIANTTRHNFKIGESVKVIDIRKDGHYRCKGKSPAHYYLSPDEVRVINLN